VTTHAVPGIGLPQLNLPERLDALAELTRIGASVGVPADLIAESEELLRRAGERLRLSASHTVVAIAGGTGSGKSSLFNALAGATFSPTGVTRPITRHVHACVWGMQGAAPLLDWLGVQRRHRYARASALDTGEVDLDGMLLLDLPDHDSVVNASMATVDRLTKLADMLIWVLDPQKYADDSVHSRYLIPLAGHSDVITVVLNQIDLLTPEQVDDCESDLRRLLDSEGLEGASLLPVSTQTGVGLDDLRNTLVRAVSVSRASSERIAADIDAMISRFVPYDGGLVAAGSVTLVDPVVTPSADPEPPAPSVPPWEIDPADLEAEAGPPARPPWEIEGSGDADAQREPDWTATIPPGAGEELTAAFVRAAGITAICDTIQSSREIRAIRYVSWPLGKLAHLRRRNDPLRGSPAGSPGSSGSSGSSGKPAGPRAVARAAGLPPQSDIDNAITDFADQVSSSLPEPWNKATKDAARSRAGDVPASLSAAVSGALPERDRVTSWWPLALAWQWLLVLGMVAGIAWIVVIATLHHRHGSPLLTDTALLPWLAVMVVALGLLGALTGSGAQNMVLLGADRERDATEARLRDQAAYVARELVVVPAGRQIAEYERFRHQLTVARGNATPPA
jgi:energy-coupling factor transporter ATP-binding protein EcfA2